MTTLGTIGSSLVGLSSGILFFVLFIAGLFIFTIGMLFYLNYLKFNHDCLVFSKSKTGVELERLKGGFITKKGKSEFRVYKPKYRINNFERDFVIREKFKTLLGKNKFRKVIYLWRHSDNKLIQLNPKFYETFILKSDRIEQAVPLPFVPRQLGKTDFEEEFDKHTEQMWDIRDFFDKHGTLIAWSGVVMTLVILNLFVVTKFSG